MDKELKKELTWDDGDSSRCEIRAHRVIGEALIDTLESIQDEETKQRLYNAIKK